MTEQCPVCLHPVEQISAKDYGRKQVVECPRCGRFEISSTALGMLGRRVEEDPIARARLSHAIRSRSGQDASLFVSSTNLDGMAKQPLPDFRKQLESLLRHLAAQLGDDSLGRVPIPPAEPIAGLIGAVNAERVERLVNYAIAEKLVDRDNEGPTVGLSPKGWEMVETANSEAHSDEPAASKGTNPEVTKAHCNNCGGDRNAYIQASYCRPGGDGEVSWSDTYDVLECCGCGGVSVRHTHWFSEWDDNWSDPISGKGEWIPGTEVKYWPPQTKRQKPPWVDNLDDKQLREIFYEVYEALNSGLVVLASIGARTIMDRAMNLLIEYDGGFSARLSLLHEQGFLGKTELMTLEAIVDAGSAAAHRGYAPSPEHLQTIIGAVESFLHQEFVLNGAAREVRSATPQRPKRPKVERGAS